MISFIMSRLLIYLKFTLVKGGTAEYPVVPFVKSRLSLPFQMSPLSHAEFLYVFGSISRFSKPSWVRLFR